MPAALRAERRVLARRGWAGEPSYNQMLCEASTLAEE